jgi:hypothetical protein
MSSYNNARRSIDNPEAQCQSGHGVYDCRSLLLFDLCMRYNVEHWPMSVRFNFLLRNAAYLLIAEFRVSNMDQYISRRLFHGLRH